MRKLKVDYIDLMLLHQPFADYYGAYRALEELAEIGKKYNKSIAQVILRWLTQRNVVALSKSTLIERIGRK